MILTATEYQTSLSELVQAFAKAQYDQMLRSVWQFSHNRGISRTNGKLLWLYAYAASTWDNTPGAYNYTSERDMVRILQKGRELASVQCECLVGDFTPAQSAETAENFFTQDVFIITPTELEVVFNHTVSLVELAAWSFYKDGVAWPIVSVDLSDRVATFTMADSGITEFTTVTWSYNKALGATEDPWGNKLRTKLNQPSFNLLGGR
jgi:hypothetical protein